VIGEIDIEIVVSGDTYMDIALDWRAGRSHFKLINRGVDRGLL
jgi:hypothetical protein